MTTKKIILALALTTAVSTVFADDDTLASFYKNEYVSFGGGATYVHKIFQTPNPSITVPNTQYESYSGILGGGGNLFIGSALSSFFGLEVGVNYYSFGTHGGLMLLALNGKFTELLGDNFLLFEKLGPGYSELTTRLFSRITNDSLVPSFGLGLGYKAASHWLVTTEFDGAWLPSDTCNGNGLMGGITVGGTYYFNS